MDFDLCVFDVAGTTVEDDGAVAACLRAAVARRGPPPTNVALTAVMGLPKPVALDALLAVSLGRAPERREVEETNDDFEDRMVEHYTRTRTSARCSVRAGRSARCARTA